MEITVASIVGLITVITTYIFGLISKKFNIINTKLLPLQNGVVGVIAGIICYTLKLDGMDLATSLITCLMASYAAGGVYDLTKTGSN